MMLCSHLHADCLLTTTVRDQGKAVPVWWPVDDDVPGGAQG